MAVIGYKLKHRLFGGEEALGQKINLGVRRLTVVGVGQKFDTTFVDDNDMFKERGGVCIPGTIYGDMFGCANAVSYMLAKSVMPNDERLFPYPASADRP